MWQKLAILSTYSEPTWTPPLYAAGEVDASPWVMTGLGVVLAVLGLGIVLRAI